MVRLLPLLALACSEEPKPTDVPGQSCGDAVYSDFVAGIAAETDGGAYTVRVASASPVQPDVGLNTWKLAVEGAPADAVVVLKPWMPLHGHGTVPLEHEALDFGEETRSVGPFNLVMPGLWDFHVYVDDQEALFTFCVEG